MKYHQVVTIVLGLSIISAWPAAAWSQAIGAHDAGRADSGSVTGVGVAKVALKPELLRMYVTMTVPGKTLQEALNNLKDRREAALVQLKKLGADVKSAKFTPPTLAAEQSDQQKRRMEQMLRERMRGRAGKPAAGPQASKSYAVSTTLTVEWPAKAETAEELLLVVETLREKVKAADLTGAKAAEKASPEAEEEAEEAAGMSTSFGEEQIKPGEPQFVCVARISAEQRGRWPKRSPRRRPRPSRRPLPRASRSAPSKI